MAGEWRVVVGMCAVLILLLFGLAQLVSQNENNVREALSERFETRAELTVSFTTNFLEDIARRERSQAERLLAEPQVDQATFESVVAAFDFEAAVLLDSTGRLIHVWPPRPEIIGRDMTDYAHLRTAVTGGIGVSEMVSSAALGMPITAVAVPFDTPAGRRVFSGAFSPAATPLGAYLESVVSVQDGGAYLVDGSGDVLAGGNISESFRAELRDLAVGVSDLESPSGRVTVAVADIPDTAWRVVVVAPTEALYAPAAAGRVAPRVLFATFAAAGCLAIVLVIRLGRARAHAAIAALTDQLTDLPNRRAMQKSLDRAVAASAPHHVPHAALMIDIDRFKAINDTHGHDAGDAVLQAVSAALRGAIRSNDVAARWGGEEFVVLLPHTDQSAAGHVAERIRLAIASTVRSPGTHGTPVTVSIGVGTLGSDDVRLMLQDADNALYQAKANGRDRVETYVKQSVDVKQSAEGLLVLTNDDR